MSVEDRFWAKVEKTESCWNWTGAHGYEGYGQFQGANRRVVGAHRQSYEWAKGPIPDGLTIDHLCRNPRCVNPEHLEAVTQRENTLRGLGPSARNAAKTECDHGHPFTPSNTYMDGGKRACRSCKTEHWRKKNGKQLWTVNPDGSRLYAQGGLGDRCKNGHINEFSIRPDGARRCRACARIATAKYAAQRSGANPSSSQPSKGDKE